MAANTTSSDGWQPPVNWEKRPVTVLGGGVLGRRIAACFVAAGHHVIIRDPSQKSREQAVEYIHENITSFTALTDHAAGSVEALEDLPTAVKDSWIIFEAVPEVLSIKESTFLDLEKYAQKDAILASNSSSFKSSDLITKLQPETKKRVLNTHYMMPPAAVIVELMTSGHTYPSLFPWLADRHKEAGLHPIVALRESTGFIFNRIWAAIKREVLAVLAEGVATPETIDSMWIEQYSGRQVGPCTLMDSVGLDTVEHIEEHYIKDRSLPDYHLKWLQDNYISKGKLGLKSDQGGLYEPPPPGSRTKIILLNLGLATAFKSDGTPPDFLHSGQILGYNPEDRSSRPAEIIGKLPCPDGIDIAQSTGRMYWTNMGNPSANDGSLQSAKLDGTDIQVVVPVGKVHTPKQLTIDQEAGKIYYCDREGLSVYRVNLDGSDRELLYQSGDWQTEPEKKSDGAYWPVGITISKKLNKFFWSQKGHSKAGDGRIFSAGLTLPAGKTPANRDDVEVVIGNLPEAIDLEFDDEDGVLYWTDRGELPLGNTLNKKHLVGATPALEKALGRQIIAQGLGEGIGLRLDKAADSLYVADLGGRLWKCSTKTHAKVKLYEGPSAAYSGLTFFKY